MLEKRETGQAESAAATAAVEEARLQESGGGAIGPNGFALLPIIVFLVLYLGSGVYFEYVRPIDGQMGFYVISVVVAFMVALTVALVQNRSLSFDEKIRHCARGIGDENIVIMLFIFLFAGVFSGLASAAGGAESTANMMLSVIPSSFAIPGLFLIAAIISLAMGTSTGTVSVLAPIAVAVSANADLNLAFCVASVIGGAMFGDNLSFISDTTIASTKTQGAAMKDKFYENAKIAIPVALVSMVVIAVVASSSAPASVGIYEFNPVLAVPYFVVLILAMTGMNVLLVLTIGILLMLLTGVAAGTLSFVSAFTSMGTGATGMFETMIVTILVAAIGALMRQHGGFAAILQFIHKHFHGRKGGMAGIGLLVFLLDVAAANNTVAIVMAGSVAKQISEEYDVSPREAASLLDTWSCIGQGIIPYGAQLLIGAGIAGISSVSIIPFLFYPMLLAVGMVVYILTDGLKFRRGKAAASSATRA